MGITWGTGRIAVVLSWLCLGLVSLGGCSKVGMTCEDEDCAPGSGRPDGSAAVSDARADSADVTPGGSSFDCVPSDAGGRCTCGAEPFSPAPTNDAGQPQTEVSVPDPATVVAYHSMEEFDALAVGWWQRTAGQGELVCEQLGVTFTADHHLIPLVFADDGSVQILTANARSFSISFDGAGAPAHLEEPGYQTNPPIFFDGGKSMYFLYAPWPARYVRL
jgi:hypothetical protein